MLSPHFAGSESGVAEENLQARIRGNLLMALSNKFGWLVLTTGNKSEMATGYATLYGDMAGGYAVIKDVPKTIVYQLAEYRNGQEEGKDPIPLSTITRPPSAELRADQRDQDSLPPYEILDRIVEAYVILDESIEEIVARGQPRGGSTKARAVPIYQTTSYTFDDPDHAADLFALRGIGNIYTRIMNPTTAVFESRMAALEGGTAAVAAASGQAAITLGLLTFLGSGDHVVAASTLYGGTRTLLQHTFARLGIAVDFVDPSDPQNFKTAIRPETRALYAESVGNPLLNTLDLGAVGAIAKEAGLPLLIDNTMPTAYLLPVSYTHLTLPTLYS